MQARSIGLEVIDALPISKENPEDFEVPSEEEIGKKDDKDELLKLSMKMKFIDDLGFYRNLSVFNR